VKWEQGFSCVAAACLVPGPCTDTFAHETFEDGVRSLTSCRAEKSTRVRWVEFIHGGLVVFVIAALTTVAEAECKSVNGHSATQIVPCAAPYAPRED
jgi:hypothetical protein